MSENESITFKTPPTVGKFMMNPALVRFIIGPYGSGKSVGCIMEMLRRAREQAPNKRGVRQTRFAIVRNTLQQIKQTCLADIQMWLSPIVNYKVSDKEIHIRLDLPDGTKVESDWLMIPIDTPEDQQRLLSLNLTGVWISEFRELPVKIINDLLGRVGRWPAKKMAPLTWCGIIGESNPPDEDSDWYNKIENDTPSGWSIFKQPGGMDANAENRENLRDGYYEDLVANNSPDWVDVHVHAKYGKSLAGEAVFRATFRPDFHVVHTKPKPIPGMSLMIAQDFGRTPAALIGQIDTRGRLVVFREVVSTDMGIELFVQSTLRPVLLQYFTGFHAYMVADPTGRHKSQVNEDSPFDVLRRLGFKCYPAPTNDLEPRLRACEQMFLRATDGGPSVMIDAEGCPLLVTAMKSKYRYKRKKAGELDESPEKTHPWSDLADDLQYMCLSMSNNHIGKLIQREQPRRSPHRVSVASWT